MEPPKSSSISRKSSDMRKPNRCARFTKPLYVTLTFEPGAREAAWRLAKSVLKLKEKNKAAFLSPSEKRWLLASNLKPEEREFVVDSNASMHIISTKDLNSVESDTLTTSCSPTIVITVNGEVQTHDKATVYALELDIFLTREYVRSFIAQKAWRWKRMFSWVDQRSKTTFH